MATTKAALGFTVEVSEESDVFTARTLEMPLSAKGDTEEEARKNLNTAILEEFAVV